MNLKTIQPPNLIWFSFAVPLLFVAYLLQVAGWSIHQADIQGYSPWPVILFKVSPLMLFVGTIFTLKPKGLICLNLMLLLYFSFSVLGLFTEGARFTASLWQSITLVTLFSCVFLYLKKLDLKNLKKSAAV